MAEENAAEEGGNDLSEEQKRLALRLRRRSQVKYLKKHRTKLEKVAQRCLNKVLLQLPEDPYEALLYQLSTHVKASGLFFSSLRILPNGDESILCEVRALARNTPVMVHRATLPRILVARGLVASGVLKEAPTLADAEALTTLELVPQLSGALGKIWAGVSVLDFEVIGSLIVQALPDPQLPSAEEGEEAAPAEPDPEAMKEAHEATTLLRSLVAGILLEASGRLLDSSSREALRAGILLFGGVGLEPEDEEGVVAPPISCQADLETWQHQWPEVLMPILQGSSARRRVCLGVGLWASTLPDVQALLGEGCELELVDEDAEEARLEALEAGDDDDDEDEPPIPEPHEFCPPLNAVDIVGKLSATLAEKAGAGGALPAGEDFAAGIAQIRQALDAALPQYFTAEKALAEEEKAKALAEASGMTAAEASAAQLAALQADPHAESDEESASSEGPQWVPVGEVLRRGSIYFALHCDADSAFDAEANTYTFSDGGQARTQEELIEYYAELCQAEPLLRLLVAPFSPRDPELEAGFHALREKLGDKVALVDEAPEPVSQTVLEEAVPDAADELEEIDEDGIPVRPEDIGRLRDCTLSPMGLVTLWQRHVIHANGCGPNLYAPLGRHGVYDLEGAQAILPAFGEMVDVMLAFPDSSRRLLIPKDKLELEALMEVLAPYEKRFRSLALTSYRRKRATDGRQKKKDINMLQFREGLRRLGYPDSDEYAELLFAFLDMSKGGTLSLSELEMITLVDGPASLQDLDELRMFLCAWKARRTEAEKAKRIQEAEEAEGEENRKPSEEQQVSPLAELWVYMDRDGSGEASFSEFTRALRKARHPAGLSADKGDALRLFMCLDISTDGTIEEGEFFCLNILSAYHQLQRVTRVREFLQERFGSLKAAFKFMDRDRKGSLSTQTWMDVMMGEQGYECEEDIRTCFIFIDKDGGGSLSSKEFEFLGQFDDRALVADVKSLCDHLVEKYENLDDAYVGFEQRIPPPDPNAPEGEEAPKKKKKSSREGRGLQPADFVRGVKMSGFKGKFDSRLHFSFLDAAHVGRITINEFKLLGTLGAVEALHYASSNMRNAIKSLKTFVLQTAQLEAPPPEERGEGDGWKWAAIHQAIRDVTHDDLDLI
eukprot:TRINITY_DN29294_c0_g1_i1.p1 TRINITY_DN29294_c0_g1~~TRINITY_DN29294_c0_g1_i1.p1  ORF type:complete len:1123 (-),score=308.10 TRINITY_DN29294_c0_g1_i1:59-3427(-)